MEYVMKNLHDTLRVTGIVNLHFFEFDNDFATVGERHPFYELVFVNSGRLHIESEDYSGELRRGQMILHRQNSVHALSCAADDSPTVIIIGFACDDNALDRFSVAPVELGDRAIKKLGEIVKEGRNVFKPPYNIPVYDMKKKRQQPFGSEQMLRLLLESFLIRLCREVSLSEQNDDPPETPTMIQEIIQYVCTNFQEKITIDELAFLFKTNRATLCKEFKRATGKTVVEFINEKKFERAAGRILSSQDTFTQIAEEMGFESIHYFTRFFKKMAGQTPKEFRRTHASLPHS